MSVMSIQQRSLNFRERNGNKLNCHVAPSISQQSLSLLSYFVQYALHPPSLYLNSPISSTVFFIYLIWTSSRPLSSPTRPLFSSPLISYSSSLLLSSPPRPLFSSHLLLVLSSPLLSNPFLSFS